MSRFRSLVVAAALGGLALPAAADAHSRPSVASVAAHARAADRALDAVPALVAAGDEARAAAAFTRSRRHTGAATREARRVAARASAAQGARAARVVARRHDANAEALTALLPQVTGDLQEQVAHAIASSLKAREQAVAVLTGLLDGLPAPAQRAVSTLIASLSRDAAGDVQRLTAALGAATLPAAVTEGVTAALAVATAAVTEGAGRLRELIPQLPAPAQPHVEAALGHVEQMLPVVAQLVTGVLDAVAPAGQAPADGRGPAGLAGLLPLFGGR